MGRAIDLTGRTFGRWTVISRAENSHGDATRWACRCECGNERTVLGAYLRRRQSRSCGCLQREEHTKRMTTHGCAGKITGTYRSWHCMKARCENQRSRHYAYYGGRGITVSENWKTFEGFLADMGERPKGLTLDRLDNSKGYYKDNCRWATRFEQQRNTRANRLITSCGKTLCLAEWCERLGIHRDTVRDRLRHGWNETEALFKPVRSRKNQQAG